MGSKASSWLKGGRPPYLVTSGHLAQSDPSKNRSPPHPARATRARLHARASTARARGERGLEGCPCVLAAAAPAFACTLLDESREQEHASSLHGPCKIISSSTGMVAAFYSAVHTCLGPYSTGLEHTWIAATRMAYCVRMFLLTPLFDQTYVAHKLWQPLHEGPPCASGVARRQVEASASQRLTSASQIRGWPSTSVPYALAPQHQSSYHLPTL